MVTGLVKYEAQKLSFVRFYKIHSIDFFRHLPAPNPQKISHINTGLRKFEQRDFSLFAV